MSLGGVGSGDAAPSLAHPAGSRSLFVPSFAMTKLASIIFATVVVGLLGLSACSQPSTSSLFTKTAAAPDVAAHQIVVLRGNVLVVDGRHLRLVDAAVPQAAPDARCVAEAVASRQAQLRLEDLTRHVRSIVVTPTGALDDHDRILARVTLDGVDPAQTLIDEGLAVTPQPGGFDWCSAADTTHPAAQRIAMLSFNGS
jgi:endonuclease YncB( thermonuclease family)